MKIIYTILNIFLLTGVFTIFTYQSFSQNLTISSGAKVTIGSSALVTGGVLNNPGTLTIKSESTGTGSLIITSTTGTGTGTIHVTFTYHLPGEKKSIKHIVFAERWILNN